MFIPRSSCKPWQLERLSAIKEGKKFYHETWKKNFND